MRRNILQDSELKRLLTPLVGQDLRDTAGGSVNWLPPHGGNSGNFYQNLRCPNPWTWLVTRSMQKTLLQTKKVRSLETMGKQWKLPPRREELNSSGTP